MMFMNDKMIETLLDEAERHLIGSDVAHDLLHLKRVMRNAVYIAEREGADLEVVIPAAIFHDIVTYRKDDERSRHAQADSAKLASIVLRKLGFPQEKVEKITYTIEVCSFTKGIVPTTIEAKVVQDADMLEAVGAIAIMRTFASNGAMRKPFYDENDPFCERRKPEPNRYALDLFPQRLLVIKDRVHTRTAKKIVEKRTRFLNLFMGELRQDLELCDGDGAVKTGKQVGVFAQKVRG